MKRVKLLWIRVNEMGEELSEGYDTIICETCDKELPVICYSGDDSWWIKHYCNKECYDKRWD